MAGVPFHAALTGFLSGLARAKFYEIFYADWRIITLRQKIAGMGKLPIRLTNERGINAPAPFPCLP